MDDIASRTRRMLRDRINRTGLLDRCVRDIKNLLGYDGTRDTTRADGTSPDRVTLQSDGDLHLEAGRNYGDEVIW